MARSTFVYVIYIRTTAERLWSALTTDAEFMKQYWFGTHCESQWTQGSPWKMISSSGLSGGWPKILSNLKSLLETGTIALQDAYPAAAQPHA